MHHNSYQGLIVEIASANDVPVKLLEDLLGLESEFSNLEQPGAVKLLQNRVTDIVLQAVPPAPGAAVG